MSDPKVTLKDIIAMVNARPTTPECELALIEFLDLSDSEQKALLFREIVNLNGQLNLITERLR